MKKQNAKQKKTIGKNNKQKRTKKQNFRKTKNWNYIYKLHINQELGCQNKN